MLILCFSLISDEKLKSLPTSPPNIFRSSPSSTASPVTATSGGTGATSSGQRTPSSSSATVPSDLGDDEPSQSRGTFPNATFGKRKQSFFDRWYYGRDWLEYSVQLDAAFCYSCRKFVASSSTGEQAFRFAGFRNWKTALEKGHGFSQHEASADHATSMGLWVEAKLRKASHLKVHTLLNVHNWTTIDITSAVSLTS